MNSPLGEDFSTIVHAGVLHTHPGGFHLCAGDRKISKTNDWSSHMCRPVWTTGRE